MSFYVMKKFAELAKKDQPKCRADLRKLFFVPEFGPSRTKQEFRDDCNINAILARATREGTLSHLDQFQGEYGDFTGVDGLLDAHLKWERGVEIFRAAPGDIRKEFGNDPARFFRFVNDPKNKDRLKELLPQIAAPGRFFPDMSPQTPPDAVSSVAAPPPPASSLAPAEPSPPSGESSGGTPPPVPST